MEINLTKCSKQLNLTENEIAELMDFAIDFGETIENEEDCIKLINNKYTLVTDLYDYTIDFPNSKDEEFVILSTHKLYHYNKNFKYNDEFLTYCLLENDEDFFNYYMLQQKDNTKTQEEHKEIFKQILEYTLNYCFNSEFNPYLDKPYLDISYLKFTNKDNKTVIINVDDIFEEFMQIVQEFN